MATNLIPMKNFKKFLNIFLLSTLLYSSIPVQTTTAQSTIALDNLIFSDISETDKNFDAIYFLYNAGIVNGYENTEKNTKEYKPEKEINRAEFLKLTMESSGKATHENFEPCFPDIEQNAWYETYVCQAKKEGIINGYPDGTFKPEETINEAESLKIIGEVMGWQIEKNDNEEWYMPYLNFANDKKIIDKKTISKLMNRGDIAEIIFRNEVVKKLELEQFDEKLTNTFFEKDDTQTKNTSNSDSQNTDLPNTSTTGNSPKISSISISISKAKIAADDLDKTKITATALDSNEEKLSNQFLIATISTGIDHDSYIQLQETSLGIYTGYFSTKLAATYKVKAEDENGNSSETKELSATPGLLDHIEIIDTTYPYQNDHRNKAFIKVTSKDKFENVLPYSSVSNTLEATTTFGTTSVTHDSKGIFTIEVKADDWGIAEINIRDKKSAEILSQQPETIYFLPIQLGMPKGIEKNKKTVSAPIYAYFPEKYGTLGTYGFTLHYDPKTLNFSKIEDLDETDNFPAPYYEADKLNGIIYISQTNSKPSSDTPSDLAAGKILFDIVGTGEGVIYVEDAVLKDTNGEEKSYLAKFGELIGESVETAENAIKAAKDAAIETGGAIIDATSNAIDSALDGIAKWAYNIKNAKEICIDVFTFPNSNTTAQQINQDISWANLIFSKIADSCNCKFYINVTLNSSTALSAADWNAIDTNGDNDLDLAETSIMGTLHPATGQTASGNKCTPLYYVPQINNNDIGWSWEPDMVPPPPNSGIALDQSQDPDNKTLAHELSHQFSESEIIDPNNPPDSATQGSDTAGNLMNYDNTGDSLTKEQCSLLEKYIK